jgi:hypothetical protein
VVPRDSYDSALLAPLWTLLADPTFHTTIQSLGGYSTTQTGHLLA